MTDDRLSRPVRALVICHLSFVIHRCSSSYKAVTRIRICLAWFLFSALAGPAVAQDKSLPDHYDNPLGTCFEELKYPYPTAFLNLYVEGQDVRMCFMDIQPPKNPNGRTVLLLHGKKFWGAYWSDTIKYLTDRGFRVVVPDQIGFGKSSKPDLHYSLDFMAENTAGLLDLLQISKAIVVGHSMGGMLGIRFARLYPGKTFAATCRGTLCISLLKKPRCSLNLGCG